MLPPRQPRVFARLARWQLYKLISRKAMAEMSENKCIVCLSEVTEPFLLQCCR